MNSFWSTVIISSAPPAQDVAITSGNQTGGYGGPLFYCHFLAKWSPFVFLYTRLISLPPRSPELNPAEHIWEEFREKNFAHRAFRDLDEVEDNLRQGLNDIAIDPKDFVQ